MNVKLVYIPNDDKLRYPIFRLNSIKDLLKILKAMNERTILSNFGYQYNLQSNIHPPCTPLHTYAHKHTLNLTHKHKLISSTHGFNPFLIKIHWAMCVISNLNKANPTRFRRYLINTYLIYLHDTMLKTTPLEASKGIEGGGWVK